MQFESENTLIEFADVVRLCKVTIPAEFSPWAKLERDGIYIVEPDADVHLWPEERAALSEHPLHDLTKPALTFPCTLKELFTVLDDIGMANSIYEDELNKLMQRVKPIGSKGLHLATSKPVMQVATEAKEQVAPCIIVKRLKNRIYDLDAEITLAKGKATNADDYLSVWASLREIALNEVGLFTGVIDPEKGIEYMKSNGSLAYFTKTGLRKRMARSGR